MVAEAVLRDEIIEGQAFEIATEDASVVAELRLNSEKIKPRSSDQMSKVCAKANQRTYHQHREKGVHQPSHHPVLSPSNAPI
jgi:hypothetical protein